MRRQIAEGSDLASIRMRILTTIHQRLKDQRGPLSDWEKTHLSNAIGALGLNIHVSPQPTFAWLRLCLGDLEKVILPQEGDMHYQSPDASMREVTVGQLRDAVESLIRELNGSAHGSALEASLKGYRKGVRSGSS
jgi:hypothetical protein